MKGATHFENLNRYPMPYWTKDMDAVAKDRGEMKEYNQTYFRAKSTSAQPKVGGVETIHGRISGEREVR